MEHKMWEINCRDASRYPPAAKDHVFKPWDKKLVSSARTKRVTCIERESQVQLKTTTTNNMTEICYLKYCLKSMQNQFQFFSFHLLRKNVVGVPRHCVGIINVMSSFPSININTQLTLTKSPTQNYYNE